MLGESNFLDIARVIQLAVAPVFLLTAIGTIINVLVQRLGRSIDLKFTPDLKFLHDESFNEAARMSRLFADPKVQQDLSPQPPSDSWKDED